MNYNNRFCPQSRYPWYRHGKFRRYPAWYRNREHCVWVWNNRAEAFGYDSDEEKELSGSKED
jgi:hypothetical protein